jgi:hypothetical protein
VKKERTLADGARESAELSEQEKEFIAMAKTKSSGSTVTASQPPAAAQPVQAILPQMTSRMNIGARCRPEIVMTVKKASLERQLAGLEPYTMQDILEEALQHWLTVNGYL